MIAERLEILSAGFLDGQLADVQTWHSLATPVQPASPASVFVPITKGLPAGIVNVATAFHAGAAYVATVVPFRLMTQESSHAHDPEMVTVVGSTPASVKFVVKV